MYERHLRRLRRHNATRREALLEAIHKYLHPRVEVTGDGSGAHVVLWPLNGISEDVAIGEAARRGVGIYGLSHCFLKRPSRPGFILGYSRLKEDEIREGIRKLGDIL